MLHNDIYYCIVYYYELLKITSIYLCYHQETALSTRVTGDYSIKSS